MTDNVKKFMEKVSADEVLQAELTAAVEGVENAGQIPVVIEFAKKKGFELTKEDFVPDDADIELNELETVVGAGGCACPFFGAGSGDELHCTCGVGYGKGTVAGMKGISTQGGCYCIIAGVGATRRH